MLATNQTFYKRVLKLEAVSLSEDGSVDWAKFFDRTSSYRLLYTLQIVLTMLNEGKERLERVEVLNANAFPSNNARYFFASYRDDDLEEAATKAPGLQKAGSSRSNVSDTQEDLAKLRGKWAEVFLKNGGFQYILKEFMSCSLPESSSPSQGEPFELKYISFMLHLLRTLTAATFATIDQGSGLARVSAADTAESSSAQEL